jgi:hypothetical protein
MRCDSKDPFILSFGSREILKYLRSNLLGKSSQTYSQISEHKIQISEKVTPVSG